MTPTLPCSLKATKVLPGRHEYANDGPKPPSSGPTKAMMSQNVGVQIQALHIRGPKDNISISIPHPSSKAQRGQPEALF